MIAMLEFKAHTGTLACGRVSVADCDHMGSDLPDMSILGKQCGRARPEVVEAFTVHRQGFLAVFNAPVALTNPLFTLNVCSQMFPAVFSNSKIFFTKHRG